MAECNLTKTAVDIVVVSSLPLDEVRSALTANLMQLLGTHTSGARPLIAELPTPPSLVCRSQACMGR